MGKIYNTIVRSRREQPEDLKHTDRNFFNRLFQKNSNPLSSNKTIPEESSTNIPPDQKLFNPSSVQAMIFIEPKQISLEDSGIDSRMITFYEPRSKAAEQFRILRARLRNFGQDSKFKTLLVLSTFPQEGKSFIAANLAISIAQVGKSPVVLFDGDLRKPSLHKLFGLTVVKGLADYLADNASFDEILHATDVAGLYLIPAGDIPHNPAELMASDRLKLLLNSIKTNFSSCWLILDSPPVISTTEHVILTEHADGFIYVIQADKTDRSLIKDALGKIDTNKLLGVVFNRTDHKTHGYYYYHPDKIKH
jgi:capsular exopolysaccharide synthesis family protein